MILQHYLPVHRSTLYEMISKGTFPAASKQIGRKMRFWLREDIEAWVGGNISPAPKGVSDVD
jgi:excisionase family DNA binding protein